MGQRLVRKTPGHESGTVASHVRESGSLGSRGRRAIERPAVPAAGKVIYAAGGAADDPPPYGLSADDEQLAKVCRALGDPVRFRLVQMLLTCEELGCAELQQLFPLSRPALSYHTRVLSECGLLSMRKDGAFHFLRLRRDRLAEQLPGGLLAGSRA